MSGYTFPSQPYHLGQSMLQLLGSHWASIYRGSDVIESYLVSRAAEQAQSHLNLLETISALSRQQTPVSHKEHWYFLQLLSSQMSARVLRYGEGVVYGPQPVTQKVYEYGGPGPTTRYTFPIPTDIVTSPVLFDRISSPTVTLTQGVDYELEPGYLLFSRNPFADSRLIQRPLYEGDQVVDYEIGLWLFCGQLDYQYMYEHWAYMLGLQLQSSEGYKAYVNAVFDSLAEGTSMRSFATAIAALTGVLPVLEETEIVESVTSMGDSKTVVTDKHAYVFPAAAEILVLPGQVVYGGQALSDLVQIHELQRGLLPESLRALSMDREFLTTGYLAGLTFLNETTDWIVTENVDGRTKVAFAIGGLPEDVARFWDEVHARGGQEGATSLARLLDVRGPAADTEPTADSLPATVNPLQFLIENLLRYNTVVVQIRRSVLPATALDLASARLLRRIVPPWTVCLLVVELESSGDNVDPEELVSEDPELAVSLSAEDEVDPEVYVSEWPTLSYEEGVCDT